MKKLISFLFVWMLVFCGWAFAAGGIISDISDVAYDADTWNNNKQGASKNVIRDKLETLGSGSGNVTATASITDNKIVRGAGGAKGVQDSNVTIEDDGNITTPGNMNIGSNKTYDINGTPLSTSDIVAAISTQTGNYTITSSDLGKCVRMSSASDIVASLLSVSASDDGVMVRIAKTGAGKVAVGAADSDLINDSGAGGTIYNNDTNETYSYIDLEYVHAITTWIAGGVGTWTTTD